MTTPRDTAVRWRRWLWLLLAVPLVAGLIRLRFDAQVLNLLPPDLSAVRGLKLYQEHFQSARDLILTLRAADADQATAAARSLAEALRAESNLVASAYWQPPFQEDVHAAGALLAWLWLNEPPEGLAALAGRLAPNRIAATLRAARDELATSLSPDTLGRLGYDPLGLTRLPGAAGGAGAFSEGGAWFASADGAFRVVFVRPRAALANYRETADWLGAVHSAVAAWRARTASDAAVRFTGGPAFVAEIATGMEHDLRQSVAGTFLLIAGLFGWAHRRWLPLIWLSVLLAALVGATMALGGLVFGELNVVSLGFAAVLLGLGVDYALVLYQEARATPGRHLADIRRTVAPGIWWSALTTSGAFLLLNFAGLPGLSQLGTLVAMGVLLAAAVMLSLFPLVALRAAPAGDATAGEIETTPPGPRHRPAWLATAVLAAASLIVLSRGWPAVHHGTEPLQPRNSPAATALDELERELDQGIEPVAVVVPGRDEAQVIARLERLQTDLARFTNATFTSSATLWPRAERQRTNRTLAGELGNRADEIHTAVTDAGFAPPAWALAEAVLSAWREWTTAAPPFWPTNAACQWLVDKSIARDGPGWLALASLTWPSGTDVPEELWQTIDRAGAVAASWTRLGEALLDRVEGRVGGLMLAMGALLVGCLTLAFRRPAEVILSGVTLGFSFLLLLAIMRGAGWTWNLMNLTALPLMLGAGVDYTIHVQLALRRHGGNARALRRVTGKALFLCAATTVAGFGSLYWSGNAGLASLGQICAVGIACIFLTALYLLPAWWQAFAVQPLVTPAAATADAMPAPGLPLPAAGHAAPVPRAPASRPADGNRNGSAASPSVFYRTELWRAALFGVRVLPGWLLDGLARAGSVAYRQLHRDRREIAVQNLLPVVGGDRPQAERLARRLFAQFALKLADLWRFEAGLDLTGRFCDLHGWGSFEAARARGRGVLLVTPHLGNWELGGPLLSARGVRLLVITQAEPGNGFTELRQASRARWGIETLVIGRDAFAFVEVIKRLQAGATVAILVDRPPAPSGVTVELFGRPFQASIAAAELARATGCAVLGVALPRTPRGYAARVLPEFAYDRGALGNRAGRIAFSQEILRAFEPIIREHPDQWYHFVPVWPEPEPAPRP